MTSTDSSSPRFVGSSRPQAIGTIAPDRGDRVSFLKAVARCCRVRVGLAPGRLFVTTPHMKAITTWGSGWAAGAILASLAVLEQRSGGSVAAGWVLMVLATALAFGIPTYVGARLIRSPRPTVQALMWVLC